MLFIVKTKAAKILSQDLSWIKIKNLKKEDYRNLLTIPNEKELAQRLCKWFASGSEIVNVLTPQTIYKKWGIDLSSLDGNTFRKGLLSKRYPDCLKKSPVDKNQIAAFQRDWVKEAASASVSVGAAASASIPVGAAASVSIPVSAAASAPVPIGAAVSVSVPVGAVASVSVPVGAAASASVPVGAAAFASEPAKHLNYPASIPIKERSSLINEMVTTFSAFGELAQRMPEMLEKKQRELAAIEKKLLDLRHIAELTNNLNAAEGYRFYKDF